MLLIGRDNLGGFNVYNVSLAAQVGNDLSVEQEDGTSKVYPGARIEQAIVYQPAMKVEMVWNMEDVRTMCIRYNYCTGMDCEEYENLLHHVRDTECTADEIMHVADWIADYSDFDGYTHEDAIRSVAYSLLNNCVKHIPVI